MTRTTGPDCAVMCNLINTEKKEKKTPTTTKGEGTVDAVIGTVVVSYRFIWEQRYGNFTLFIQYCEIGVHQPQHDETEV